ncbi:LolA-related protein [Roseiterribacter gracilis]|uniref:Outer membrane lipoprotein carrier protein LolA n=1 Tax=Roseiterribacter gracilis TaxID=2812848 RepID=A0A8S8X5W1_9PROT|nr:hypothetical protein TMPK1_04350 [Rhodospirillales bacterium TMPK1]
MISGANLFLTLLLFATPAEFTLADLLQTMRGVKQADATFVERRDIQLLSVPINTSGRLTYVAPDRLEKLTLEPRRELMTVTAREVTIAPDDAEPTVIPLDQAPELRALVDGLRATLAGDERALLRSYDATFSGRADAWQLDLVPKSSRLQQLVRSLHIEGSGTSIRKVDTVDASGDRASMTITAAK